MKRILTENEWKDHLKYKESYNKKFKEFSFEILEKFDKFGVFLFKISIIVIMISISLGLCLGMIIGYFI